MHALYVEILQNDGIEGICKLKGDFMSPITLLIGYLLIQAG
jgi:hypothetical protein